jgi:hypothetical protein
MPDVITSKSLTDYQRRALDWAWRTVHGKWAPRQPTVATLNRLARLGLLTFTTRTACRMTIVHDLVLTEDGKRIHSEGMIT